ncbi:MAG: copper ABC transporter ATP-binding protein [Acidobacteria bacterium SCN 69-37]|nr:MAG: copper ABC transporter ATP-binding protein [Acidobacteria bacterium SCN 69-37]
MNGDSMVHVEQVTRHYGLVKAVDGVDLDVGRGEIFGLIGHNGAGKSTLFRLMLGLERPTTGRLAIDGVPVLGRGFRGVRRRMGYVPETVVLYENLTGLETLAFYARLKGAPAADGAAVLERVGLAHAGGRRVGEYSKGMRQRLGIAQALLGSPALLFLDEPTTGLDPEAIRAFYALLGDLKTSGATVVLSSHSLAEIQERVDRVAIMVSGRVRAAGTVAELRAAVALPVAFRLRTRPGAESAVQSALDGLPLDGVRLVDDALQFRCPRDRKMAALARLAACGDDVHDIEIREPSLEDVFFGVAE